MLLCYAGDDEALAAAAIEPLLHLGTVQAQDIQKKPFAQIRSLGGGDGTRQPADHGVCPPRE